MNPPYHAPPQSTAPNGYARTIGLTKPGSLFFTLPTRGLTGQQTMPSEGRNGLPASQDRLNELRAQKSEVDQTPDVAPGDAFTGGQLMQRSGATGGQLLKP